MFWLTRSRGRQPKNGAEPGTKKIFLFSKLFLAKFNLMSWKTFNWDTFSSNLFGAFWLHFPICIGSQQKCIQYEFPTTATTSINSLLSFLKENFFHYTVVLRNCCTWNIYTIITKGGLISESFSLWLKSPKNGRHKFQLTTIHLKRRCSGE